MESTTRETNVDRQKLTSEFFEGDWRNFFNMWDRAFSSNFRKSMEYKIMTLKLRVHFAILPIRIVELRQHVDRVLDEFKGASKVLENAVAKYSSADYERDAEDGSSSSMKQLEGYLNSHDGQRLAKKLKGSPFASWFALPYIVNPHEDESIGTLFGLDWLEKLVDELDEFAGNFLRRDVSTPKKPENVETERDSSPRTRLRSSHSHPGFAREPRSSESTTQHHRRKVHSAVKHRDIQNWIAGQRSSDFDDNSRTRHTQTDFDFDSGFCGCSCGEELRSTRTKLFKIYRHYKKLRSRFHQLHEDYQKMNEIAEELTIALESSVQGQPVNFETIMQSCLGIFPDRFHRDVHTDSEDTSAVESQDEGRPRPRNALAKLDDESNGGALPVPPELLDYQRIKQHLRRESDGTKLLLLQALRQKITLSESEHRNETVSAYVDNDLLEIWTSDAPDANEGDVLPRILQPLSTSIEGSRCISIQETTARLLNALASIKSGRNYLTSNPMVLNSIIKYLDSRNNNNNSNNKNEPEDAATLDMLLATLQKMSLRKRQRNYMVEANLVEWLLHHLNDERFRTSAYRLEYACALLMNLSLMSAARARASLVASLLVSTAITLLSLDSPTILPYVNGALQNFLMNDEVNEEAKKFHLGQILEYRRAKSDEETRNHFSHTLRIHRRECEEHLSDDDDFSDEDDEIFDAPEREIEENDPVRPEADEFQGDQLLALCYSVPAFHSASKSFFNEKRVVEESRSHTSRRSKTGSTVTLDTRETVKLNDSKTKSSQLYYNN